MPIATKQKGQRQDAIGSNLRGFCLQTIQMLERQKKKKTGEKIMNKNQDSISKKIDILYRKK